MLDLSDPRLHVAALPVRLHLYQLSADLTIPEELLRLPPPSTRDPGFYSVTYAPGEVSIVTSVLAVSDAVAALRGLGQLKYEGPWSCLKINGPMDLTMTGVMAYFTAPLARRAVAIFAISTYNTDFVLVHDADRLRALSALREAGWTVDDLGAQYKLPLTF